MFMGDDENASLRAAAVQPALVVGKRISSTTRESALPCSRSRRNLTESGPLTSGRGPWSQVKVQDESMAVVRSIVIATLWLVLVPLASCGTTHGRMIRAADRLERNADAFDSDTRYEPDPTYSASGYFRDAREFIEEAHDFRQTVDSAGDQGVIFAYEHLWRSYHALRDEVDRLHSRQARADLKPVTEAFVDVQRIVKNAYSYADSTVYASGGYQFDPYYN
jgi:hypothetical protein